MNDWQDSAQVKAINDAIAECKLRQPGWFERFSALRKLAAVAERFDAAHPELLRQPEIAT